MEERKGPLAGIKAVELAGLAQLRDAGVIA